MSFKVLSNEIHSSRIQKELACLQSNFSDFSISFSTSVLGEQVQILIENLSFQINLSKKYPEVPPIVSCNTVLSFPSLSDGRDLLRNILTTPWSPVVSLYEITASLSVFINSNLQDIGEFHLSMPMHTSTWENKPDMHYFFCSEIDLDDSSYLQERVIVVTHSHLLILQVFPMLADVCHLIEYGFIQDILSIGILKESSEILCLQWQERGSKGIVFRSADAEKIVKAVCKNFNLTRALNSFVEGNERLKEIKIYEVLENIRELEGELENQCDNVILSKLAGLIQIAVEYFSAAEDPRYVKYLDKLHNLLINFNSLNQDIYY